jgi:hypothetical protein
VPLFGAKIQDSSTNDPSA